jgi:hypothetical protein
LGESKYNDQLEKRHQHARPTIRGPIMLRTKLNIMIRVFARHLQKNISRPALIYHSLGLSQLLPAGLSGDEPSSIFESTGIRSSGNAFFFLSKD